MSVTDIIDSYFGGEKLESAWIVLAGAVALGAALLFWFVAREPFAKGLAAALLLTAALGLIVGGTVYLRTDAQVAALGYTIDFFAEERARTYQRGLADVGAIPAPAES
jgi:hypothetical protein